MNDPHSFVEPPYLSVKQAAAYLQLNPKKIYALANQGIIPGTKVTGKWMFPRELLDRWMLDSSHSGLLSDRLIIAGGDDPLFTRVVRKFSNQLGNKALLQYFPTSTRHGLELLQAQRLDVCCIHWGPATESNTRHPALLRHYSRHMNWILIRAFKREHGLIVSPQQFSFKAPDAYFEPQYRWVKRQNGSGTLRFLQDRLSGDGKTLDDLNHQADALSEHESAAAITMDLADVAIGTRAIAREYSLEFISLGWEAFDLALTRNIWFRHLFQDLIKQIRSVEALNVSQQLGGYDFERTGELIWGSD